MGDRNHWAWSTHPTADHIQTLNGGSGWWTCHADTRHGDLAIVYLTTPMRHLAYLVKATTDAVIAETDPSNPSDWAGYSSCGFQTITPFAHPLTLAEMKADRILAAGFSALRGNFQMNSYRVPIDIWNRVLTQLVAANPGTKSVVGSANRPGS